MGQLYTKFKLSYSDICRDRDLGKHFVGLLAKHPNPYTIHIFKTAKKFFVGRKFPSLKNNYCIYSYKCPQGKACFHSVRL